jgi:hypothetical protein
LAGNAGERRLDRGLASVKHQIAFPFIVNAGPKSDSSAG